MKFSFLLAIGLVFVCFIPAALGQITPLPEFDTPVGFPCGHMSTASAATPVDGMVHIGLQLVEPGESFGALVEADLERLSRGCAQVVFKTASPIRLGPGREAAVFHAIAPETVGVATVAYFMKDGHLARVAKRTSSEVQHWLGYSNFKKLVIDFATEATASSSTGAATELERFARINPRRHIESVGAAHTLRLITEVVSWTR